MEFKAIITRGASKVLDKSNGGKYVLHEAKVLDGALAGKTVTCSRTLVNKDGDTKEPVEVKQEVTLHATIQEDSEGNRKPFFEISASNVESDENLLAILEGANTQGQSM